MFTIDGLWALCWSTRNKVQFINDQCVLGTYCIELWILVSGDRGSYGSLIGCLKDQCVTAKIVSGELLCRLGYRSYVTNPCTTCLMTFITMSFVLAEHCFLINFFQSWGTCEGHFSALGGCDAILKIDDSWLSVWYYHLLFFMFCC